MKYVSNLLHVKQLRSVKRILEFEYSTRLSLIQPINLETKSAMSESTPTVTGAVDFPGDEILSFAPMIYDQYRTVHASPDDIWPWLLQVGKSRGGWYLTRRFEHLFPHSWRATRSIEPAWQELKIGDRIPDYGSANDYLEVVSVQRPEHLIFRSERYGTNFSWAILLEPLEQSTLIHLRFRGDIRSKGLRRKMIVAGGGLLDWITTTPMLAGLAERAESSSR